MDNKIQSSNGSAPPDNPVPAPLGTTFILFSLQYFSANNADLVDSANGFGFRVSDVEKTSGEIIYIDNRAPVDRTSTTQEDIKVVITL